MTFMKIAILLLLIGSFAISVTAQVPEGKTVISSLYVYDVQTGKSSMVTRELRHLESPKWSKDGTYFIIEAYGRFEKMSMIGDRLGYIAVANKDALKDLTIYNPKKSKYVFVKYEYF